MSVDPVSEARERRDTARARLIRSRIGPPLDISDEELDALAEITARDQQLALAHARQHGTARFVALLQATTPVEVSVPEPE